MSTSSPTPDSTASLRPPDARKSAPSVSAIQVGADGSGKGWLVAVIAKRTWTVARGHCHLAPQQVPLVDEPIYDEGRAVLVHDADVILNRAKADVVVDGHVYPPAVERPSISKCRWVPCCGGPGRSVRVVRPLASPAPPVPTSRSPSP